MAQFDLSKLLVDHYIFSGGSLWLSEDITNNAEKQYDFD